MKFKFRSAALILLFFIAPQTIPAQTDAFTFQGKLADTGTAATGTYQMEFRLFDALTAGTQIGSTISIPTVSVSQGIFSAPLNFGANAFPGPARFLEIAVRRNAGEAFVTLSPRQEVNSSPYSIKSKSTDLAQNANQLGGVAAGEYVTTSTVGNSFIKNDTAAQTANFNISGNGFFGGRVGIGTTSPTFPLSVAASGHGITQTDGVVTVGTYVSSLGGWLGTRSNHPLHFFANNSAPLMTLAGNGFLGIGTFTPNAGLELRGTGPITQQRITDTASGNSLVLQGGAGDNMKVTGYNYNTGTAVPLFLSVDGAHTVLNTGGGNVGIGVSPNAFYRLDIAGPVQSTGNSTHFVAHTNGGTNSWARFYMRTTNRSWFMGTSQNFNGDQLYIADESAGQTRLVIAANGNVGIGTTNPTQTLDVLGTGKMNVLQITGGSDLAENFAVAGDKTIKAGMVVAIDPRNAGKLVLSRGAYNRRVAGIVSGANDLSAGMLLPDLKKNEDSRPVALSGRVWVYADAKRGAIRPGDLLTTSPVPGHAMKVVNYSRAQGAIIGKAMSELKSGTGLVLVLVTLQ